MIILLLAASCLILGCNKTGDNMSSLDMGMEAIKRQEYSEAAMLFDKAVIEGADKRLSYRGMGMAQMGLARYPEAIEAFKTALSASDGVVDNIDYDISYYMGTAELKAGMPDEAYETYSAILDLRPRDKMAYYLRGNAELKRGNKESAISDFNSAVSLAPSDLKLYIRIHDDLLREGMDADATSFINLALTNNSRIGAYELGIFNYYLGDYTQARNYFEEASKGKKASEESVLYLARTYAALGDESYAKTLYENYIGSHPGSAEIYNELGMLRFKEEDYEGALSDFESGLDIEDNASVKQSLLYNEIVAHEYLKDFGTAASKMKAYISLYPDDEDALRENKFLSTR